MEPTASGTLSSRVQNMVGKLSSLNFLNHHTRKDSNSGRKLNSDEVMKLVFLIATFTPQGKIVEKMQEEFGVTIHVNTVNYYRRHEAYQKVIANMRQKWGNEILDVELTHKRRRLEELERIYQKCLDSDQMKNALGALYQIQHEVEKDLQNLSLTNYNINIYKDMTEKELEEERLKSLERLKLLKGKTEEIKEVQDAVREEKAETQEVEVIDEH